jgi:monovalent cation:H+ antiporter-2, CPA2 family
VLSNLFFILLAALIGGLVAKLAKLPSLVGYIAAGIVGGIIFALDGVTIQNIAELGVVLLLFSVGLEISLEKLLKVGKVAILGSILQIILFTGVSYWILNSIGGMQSNSALVLSLAFSLSSTALIVKIMSDAEETGTIHYEIMTSWSLVQDLAVIPIVVLLPTFTLSTGAAFFNIAAGSLLTTVLVLGIVFLIGKLIAPYLTHLVAATNNREFLLLLAITLALGTASLVTLFGISAAFGAFLAGLVISKTQENHAIFSETRPLRDIFSILFFVSLGFLVSPTFILSHFFVILGLAIFVIALKALITFILCIIFGIKGKTAISVSLGLAQVGEFAFVLFLIAGKLGILPEELSSIGIAVTLVTLLISPFLFKSITPVWKILKDITSDSSSLRKLFVSGNIVRKEDENNLKNHIVICGFGRMGKWITKALKEIGVDFVIIDYNRKVIHNALIEESHAIYGDASLPEVLEAANISSAKAVIITLTDPIAQEEIIVYCQKNFPNIKIMARAHLDSDMKKLGTYKIHKVIQPEFEGALSAVKSILVTSGKSKEEVAKKIKSLRLSHANI